MSETLQAVLVVIGGLGGWGTHALISQRVIQGAPPFSPAYALGRRLEKHSRSQEVLAFEYGLHRTFVAHVERQARNILVDNLERIAYGLQVHPL